LPFIKPQWVRQFFENEILSYNDAVRCAVDTMEIDKDKRNILITHQFVTGATRSDSEDITVGGTDNVDGEVFSDFDYVALGHLHSPQSVGKENIRYSGTPLKYSFSEENDNKSITVIDLYEKGDVKISTLPLIPIRDLVTVEDKYENLMTKSFYDGKSITSDYVNIILTDEEEIVDASAKLRTVYKNFMHLEYRNSRSMQSGEIINSDYENKTPLELFSKLFKMQNNKEMTPQQSQYFEELALRVAEVNDEA
jgi:exonuclease SbcD